MIKIATHNSGSGEISKNFIFAISRFLVQTQTKTIAEQWKLGVRYFDLHIDKDYRLICGFWKSDKFIWDVLNELENLARTDKTNKTYYQITIEDSYNNYIELADKITVMQKGYLNLFCTKIYNKVIDKKCTYCIINLPCAIDYPKTIKIKDLFKLDIKSLYKCIPIPFIRNKFYKKEHILNTHMFTMIDFI